MADELGSLKAEAWYDELMAAIQSLQAFPNRCALAPESQEFQQQIRQLFIGKSKRYRVMFVVAKDVVFVLYVRHTSRAWLTDEVGEDE
jgi:plasmid stabilization system protein ParE